MRTRLIAVLLVEERLVLAPYRDLHGYWTLGVGHLIDNRKGGALPAYIHSFPITEEVALRILGEDITVREAGLDDAIPWWRRLSETRQIILMSMAFQLGVRGLLGFVRTLNFLRAGAYGPAADEMLDSVWARTDSPERARRHAAAVRNDQLEL